jgi:predicted metal-dependent phosphoesterase TrpH
VVKVDLHIHTADDPADVIPHTTTDVIDRAASLGYGAIAITLHDKQLDLRRYVDYAAARGLVLIPGIERTIHGRHVLLLNFGPEAERVDNFADVGRLKRDTAAGIVIAPHPFFPAPNCLRQYLDRHADLFDAVEWNAMYTPLVNFNRRAARWAARHGKPIVGNGDVHRLRQLGTTYSLVDAAADPAAICAAVAAGRVRLETRPLSMREAGSVMAELLAEDIMPRRPAATAIPRSA